MAHIIPNLFIIGAMKAGTSSLHEYLHEHPQIFMALAGTPMKEISYFAPHKTDLGLWWGEGCEQPGLDWYLELFKKATNVEYAGETSVLYTARPWIEGCEKRIYRFNPNAKIIYILRDPVERAISHYWYNVQGGTEVYSPLKAFKKSEEYVARSDYAMQIIPYFSVFSPEQILILTLEDLRDDPQTELRKIFEWLKVNPNVPIDTSRRFNVAQSTVKQTRLGFSRIDLLMKHWRWKRVEPKLPKFIPTCLRSITYRKVDKIDVDIRPAIGYLRSVLTKKNDYLVKLLGRTFPKWSTLYGTAST